LNRLQSAKSSLVLPQDRGFQSGLRVAAFSPFITSLGGAGIISLLHAGGEAQLGWQVLHVAAFGVIQIVWLAPAVLVCVAIRATRVALGLAVGAAGLLLANAAAWALGLALARAGVL
jgi:hypothetical protein